MDVAVPLGYVGDKSRAFWVTSDATPTLTVTQALKADAEYVNPPVFAAWSAILLQSGGIGVFALLATPRRSSGVAGGMAALCSPARSPHA